VSRRALPARVLDLALGLKAVDRAGWAHVALQSPESVAAHSWGVAWLGLVLAPPHLDRERVLALALLHDLPEVVVGDITPHDGVSAADKADAEHTAAAHLLGARADLWGLWEDYEKNRSAEAHFVHELDKLDMALQALHYARTQGVCGDEFVASARRQITTPELVAVLEAAHALDLAANKQNDQPGGQES